MKLNSYYTLFDPKAATNYPTISWCLVELLLYNDIRILIQSRLGILKQIVVNMKCCLISFGYYGVSRALP